MYSIFLAPHYHVKNRFILLYTSYILPPIKLFYTLGKRKMADIDRYFCVRCDTILPLDITGIFATCL